MAKKKEELEKEPKVAEVTPEEIVPVEEVPLEVPTEEHIEEVTEVKEDDEYEKEIAELEETLQKEPTLEPVVGEQPIDTPKIFPPNAYDVKATKPDTLQEKLIMSQGLHYLAESIKNLKKAREEREMENGKPRGEIMYYGTYSVDWTDVTHREIGKTIPEIAYLNYWAPQRCVMLNVEWLPRLVADGYILKDLTPGTWEGYINERNVAKYMKKVDYLLKKGKIRP